MGVLGSLGNFAGGVATGIESGSQIRSRNAASQELEDRVARQRREDDESRGDTEIGGQFVEGALIPEGMEVGAYFDQQVKARREAAAAAEKERQAQSLGGRARTAIRGVLTRDNVRQTGAAAGMTGVPGIPGPTGPDPATSAAPPKMRPMTAREAAEGRAMSARVFNRKDRLEKTGTELVAETLKERANAITTLSASEMGPALSRYANGAKIEVIPNQMKEGQDQQTYTFKMNGEVIDGNITRAGIAAMAPRFVEHDMEGAYKAIALDRGQRQLDAVNAAKLAKATVDLATAQQALATTKETDPLKVAALKTAAAQAAVAQQRAVFANNESMWALDPTMAESVISEQEQDPKNKDNPYFWEDVPVRKADGSIETDDAGKPVTKKVSVARRRLQEQQDFIKTNYYRNFIRRQTAPDGSPVWVLNDGDGTDIDANTNYNALYDEAQRKWGGKPPPRTAKKPTGSALRAQPTASPGSTWRGPPKGLGVQPGAR